jgi:CRISPR/Cas system-associated exonuclease Cas4 (RecB family)
MVAARLTDYTQDESPHVIAMITPSRAQAFSTCAYRFAHEKKTFDANRSLIMGQWIHEIIRADNMARIGGQEVSIEQLIVRNAPPGALVGSTDDEEWAVGVATDSLRGYRAFLDAQGVETVLDAERYVRTPTRPVAGVPGCSIVLSGRFDATAARQDRSIACIDVKTGRIPAQAHLAEAPSTYIYHHLTQYAYDADRIDIIQVNPLTGQWAGVRLTEGQIEAGKAFCRAMAAAIKDGLYAPNPGEYCAYCALAPRCPAHQARTPGWDTAF